MLTLSLHRCSLTLRVPWERGQRCQGDRASWDTGSVWGSWCHHPGSGGVHRAEGGGDSPGGGTNTVPAPVGAPSLCPPAGLLRFEVPSLHVSPEAALCRDPPEAAQRLSGPSLSPRQEEEEESESTAL